MHKTTIIGLMVGIVIMSAADSVRAAGCPDTYGLSNRAIGLGGAFTAVADDFSAVYYNPAGLGQLSGTHFALEYRHTSPNIEIKKANGEKLVIYDAAGQVRNDPTQGTAGHGLDLDIPLLGFVIDVNRISELSRNVKLGIIMSFPEKFNINYRIRDYPPDQPQLLRYGDNADRMTLGFGLGIEALKDLAYVGGGVQGMIYGPGSFTIDGMSLSGQNVVAQSEMGVLLKYYPVVGLLYTPWEKRIRIGLSWRDAMEIKLGTIPIRATVRSGNMDVTVPMQLDINAFFTPEEYSAGLAFDLDPLLVSFEINKQLWSDYEFSVTDSLHYIGAPDFKDTYNYRVGLEYKPAPRLSLMAGYFRQPSPVPDQSGRVSNYIDMDKDCFSLGSSYTFDPIPGWTKGPSKLGLSFQYQKLESLLVNKTGITGISWVDQESYTVKGDAWTLGASFGLSWK